jgi:tetratricopeptide (TPR) repeat protein
LIEADSGSHVWADRFDGTIEDIFELQDELTAKIVGALGPEMTMAEIELRRNKAPANFDAWDYYLKAMPHYHAITEPDFRQAVIFLEQSIEKDPGFAASYALLGLCHAHAAMHGWSGRSHDNVETALRYARKAIALDPLNALGHSALSQGYLVHGPMDEAIAAAERALELEPNNATYWRQLGVALGFAGRPEEALAAAENAERGSPRDPERFHVIQCQSCAHFVAGRLEEAYRKSRQAARLQPNFYASYAFMSATAGLLGKEDEAKAAARSLLKLVPRFSIAATRRNPMFERAEDLERMIEGFRLAGLPEE